MTFLEMCQKVAEESGTVASLPNPQSVTGQAGRLLRIVNWVNGAYGLIQSAHPDWLWMRGTFEGQLLPDVREYAGDALNATRFARFARTAHGQSVVSVYDHAIGPRDEAILDFRDFDDFYATFLTGGRQSERNKPTHITRTPDNRLAVWPMPDRNYTVRGMYHKARHTLAGNDDVPDLPPDYHMVIVYRALMLLATFDEDAARLGVYTSEFTALYTPLCAHYLPQIELGAPLA
jgi:hypothetical protein